MFKSFKQQTEKIPSWVFKNNLITLSISFGIAIFIFVAMAIFYFVKYSKDSIWWIGFIPLAIAIATSLLCVFLLKWLLKSYKAALLREQNKQKSELSQQEEIEKLKREIEELKRK